MWAMEWGGGGREAMLGNQRKFWKEKKARQSKDEKGTGKKQGEVPLGQLYSGSMDITFTI